MSAFDNQDNVVPVIEEKSMEQQGKKRKGKQQARPEHFKELETAAKNILEAKGLNYYDWLHKQHDSLVQSTVFKNLDSIGLLVQNQKTDRG
ncbi:hypothetical protein [Paenibacillus larvae]|uniref:Uncharacterized protein n=1 Tax=Paenibacillus larvae subsp. larvae TaxID=147375 RepID=A0A2L1U7C8_9BACL|nr:hypothetical protein [Paenibacillus larvae]AVF28822.1 hypothetical protein ERICIII_04818 [Paenibacillus larvae subsp. larvae]MCY9500284.1 hypothetical protein [Paenibacillus larvae]MCY9746968.1 hypothetical protein [Paenibacillus larvae]MCY9752462.1 hypothetical protein [Paenibacillus larvae]MDR5608836.1 hypothetical protein [Paenibacillus larvae]